MSRYELTLNAVSSNNHFALHLRTLTCAVIVAAVRGSRFIALALVLSACTGPGAARAARTQVLHGHVPAAVAQLPAVGRLAGTNHLRLALGLPLRNTEQLNKLLREIYDPTSPNFQHYLTPAQFADLFGPNEADYRALMKFARANGFTVTATHLNRAVLSVSGSVADIEQTFHVTMHVYNHPTEARTFYAPAAEPSLDAPVTVLHISGLDNYALPRPRHRVAPLSRVVKIAPKAGSGPSGSYRGNDFRAAYVPGTTLTGAGQNVGLLQFDGYYSNDIASYITQAGISTSVILTNVAVDGGISRPGDGNGEVCLDIEMAIAMAPGLAKIFVYEAPNPSPWVDLLSQMANDNVAKQLSCSWGGGGPDASAEQIFKQMAAQGQSFFSASGDSDSFVGTSNFTGFPGDSTNITQVGGTVLTTTGPVGAYVSETVWNDQIPNPNGGYWGSSGGISANYPIPAYQQGLSMTANLGSTTMRNVPDVALTADNIWVTYDNGNSGIFGGTSCAAPLWAGFTALVNQQAAASSLAPVGFLNPALYTIGKSAAYTNHFHDITTGDNTWPTFPTQFYAVTGYDLCTGWGTPRGTNLINRLAPSGPNLALSGTTLLAEGCSPTNGVIDPGETVVVAFTLTNSGSLATANLVASLLATNGVTAPGAPRVYGVVAPGASAAQSFTFTATGTCGGRIIATLQLQDGTTNYGTVACTLPLGRSVTRLTESFDAVTAPALPAVWVTSASGAQSNWVTSAASADTAPNAACASNAAAAGVNELESPFIWISGPAAVLAFRQRYHFMASSTNSAVGYDGGVLEISMGDGAYTDIVAAAGTWISGGYNATLSTNFDNPLAGRPAWSGDSGGYLTTAVNLPAAAANQFVKLRWRGGTGSAPSAPAAAPSVSSNVLVFWSFDLATNLAETVAAGLAVTPLTASNVTGEIQFTRGNPDPAISVSGFTTAAGPPTTNYSCYAFTLTISNGYQVSLAGLSFDDQAPDMGPANYSVQISRQADFSTVIYDSGAQATHASFSNTPMSSLVLTNAGLTGTVYFRLYGYGAGRADTWQLDNVELLGNVSSAGPGGWSLDTVTVTEPVCCPEAVSPLTFQNWQILYFGSTTTTIAAPDADADGTGQNNYFKYVAGLDPTNPASVFWLQITKDVNFPTLIFWPWVSNRSYTLQYRTDLAQGQWAPLTGYADPVTNGDQISITDTNPVAPQKFYRLHITLP